MSPLKCFVCLQPSIEFPQDFKAVITDFIRVFNQFNTCSDVTNLILCKSCWAYFMRIHQLAGNLNKETRDVKFAFLSSKIEQAQRSALQSGNNNLTGDREDFVAQIVTTECFKEIKFKGQSHCLQSSSVSSPKTSDNKSSTGSVPVSESSTEKDRTEEAPTDASGSDTESQPVREINLLDTYNNKWLPKNGKLPTSSSLVKRLSETEFIYLDKYAFQGTEFGFKCGLCPQVCLFCFYEPSALWYNMVGHIRKWHRGDLNVRKQKIVQRSIEVAPNHFQYGKYVFEKIDGKYQCGECGSLIIPGPPNRAKTRYILEHIIEKHEYSSRTYVCEYCGVVYNNQDSLRNHKIAKHGKPNGQFPCNDCGKIFPTQQRALVHQKQVHSKVYNRTEFICEVCAKICHSKVILEDHVAFVHKGQKVKCKDCDKMFASKAALCIHRNVHTGKTKYSCDICGMNFTQHYSVTRHKKTAHGT